MTTSLCSTNLQQEGIHNIIDTSVTYLKCTCHDIKEIKGACVLFVFLEIGIIEYRVSRVFGHSFVPCINTC